MYMCWLVNDGITNVNFGKCVKYELRILRTLSAVDKCQEEDKLSLNL